MKTKYKESEIRQILKNRIKYGVTQKQLASELGISESYFCDFLQGRRGIGEKIPAALGFKIETFYIKKGSK